MMPVTSPHPGGATSVSDQLGPGVWVVGFFLDNDKQQPVIMGSIGRVPNSKTESDDQDLLLVNQDVSHLQRMLILTIRPFI